MYTRKAIQMGVTEPLRIYIREQRRCGLPASRSEVERHLIEIDEHLQNASKDWEQRDVMVRHMLHMENHINTYLENHAQPASGILQEWAFGISCVIKALREVIPVPKREVSCERCSAVEE